MSKGSFAFHVGVSRLPELIVAAGLVAGFQYQNPAQPLSWHIMATACVAMMLLTFLLSRERPRKRQELLRALQLSATKLLLQGSASRQSVWKELKARKDFHTPVRGQLARMIHLCCESSRFFCVNFEILIFHKYEDKILVYLSYYFCKKEHQYANH